MTEARTQDPTAPLARNPEVGQVEVDFVARTPHLIAFIERDYVDGHGAHPNSTVAGLLYDRWSGRRLAVTDLLQPGANRARLDEALVRGVVREKTARDIPPDLTAGFVKRGMLAWSGGVDLSASHDMFGPPEPTDAKSGPPVLATLTASSVRDRAGGLQFLYSPYDIGSYAEGAYRIVLPWRVFVASLKPEYRSDFAGAPAGDLSSDPLISFPADVPPYVH